LAVEIISPIRIAEEEATSAAEAQPRLLARIVSAPGSLIDDLPDHAQVELEAVQTYERSHKRRDAVFNKLRYQRARRETRAPGSAARHRGYRPISAASVDAARRMKRRGRR
jgi:hypothetical protein